MTSIIDTTAGTWYTLNATRACTITEWIDGESTELLNLSAGGTGRFFASGSSVTIDTEGKYRILPTKAPAALGNGGSKTVDQTYTPNSSNAQSGTAVAGAIALGSLIETLPDSPDTYTLKQGAAVQLTEYTDTLELLPSTLTTAQEMRVLYSPAETRTTPLIAVPQGVTLHWAGDAEPTWEAGKDYVIQLLQTDPTHLEARLFNAPQGAKLPDWLTDDASGFVAWRLNTAGAVAPVAGNVDRQKNGNYQFARDGMSNAQRTIGADISAVFRDATFAEQTRGQHQFSYVLGDISLPRATFAACTQFHNMFERADGSITLNAFNPPPTANYYRLFYARNGAETRAYSFECRNGGQNMFEACGGNIYLPSLTYENATDVGNAKSPFYLTSSKGTIYVPHLNLQAAEKAEKMWEGTYSARGMMLEILRCVVYGPLLTDDDRGGTRPADTVYTDAEGIVQMIDPADVQGEHLYTNGNRPTGWGIQDFRTLNEDGTFATDAAGNYVYPWSGASPHVISLELPAAAQGSADYLAAENECVARGWQFNVLRYR